MLSDRMCKELPVYLFDLVKIYRKAGHSMKFAVEAAFKETFLIGLSDATEAVREEAYSRGYKACLDDPEAYDASGFHAGYDAGMKARELAFYYDLKSAKIDYENRLSEKTAEFDKEVEKIRRMYTGVRGDDQPPEIEL